MVNKPKIQGTAFETLTVKKLNLIHPKFKARRLAEGGMNDEGDIECKIDNGFIPKPRIVFEAKHRANLNVHQTLHKAKNKSKDTVILAWKKTKRQNNNVNRTADGEAIVYILDEPTMFELLKNYNGGLNVK